MLFVVLNLQGNPNHVTIYASPTNLALFISQSKSRCGDQPNAGCHYKVSWRGGRQKESNCIRHMHLKTTPRSVHILWRRRQRHLCGECCRCCCAWKGEFWCWWRNDVRPTTWSWKAVFRHRAMQSRMLIHMVSDGSVANWGEHQITERRRSFVWVFFLSLSLDDGLKCTSLAFLIGRCPRLQSMTYSHTALTVFTAPGPVVVQPRAIDECVCTFLRLPKNRLAHSPHMTQAHTAQCIQTMANYPRLLATRPRVRIICNSVRRVLLQYKCDWRISMAFVSLAKVKQGSEICMN